MSGTTLIDRAVLRLSGDDVRGFLQGLVTNDVSGALPVWAGLLTPQGKVLFDFIVWGDGDDLLIDCEVEQVEALARRLGMYRLRRAIVIARDEGLAVHWSLEEPSQTAIRQSVDSGPWPSTILNDPRLSSLGLRWLAPPDGAAGGWLEHRLGLDVAEGVAELGSGETLWLECNAGELNGVSYTKGCYVGQENTARMHHRSKVNRRLVVVPIDAIRDEAKVTARYPKLGLAVERRRVEEIDASVAPGWLRGALEEAGGA